MRETLGTVEVNMVQNLVDPYCVAMATKTKEVGTEFNLTIFLSFLFPSHRCCPKTNKNLYETVKRLTLKDAHHVEGLFGD